MGNKPYENWSDLEKCQSQWNKLQGLHSRKEWSASIVRAATAAEISANFAIRAEFAKRTSLSKKFVDSLLRWANGLNGKVDHLLIPLTTGSRNARRIAGLKELASDINKTRNEIVHQGKFCGEFQASQAIDRTRRFVEGLVRIYEPSFHLKENGND